MVDHHDLELYDVKGDQMKRWNVDVRRAGITR